MKKFYLLILPAFLFLLSFCQQQETFTEGDKAAIEKEVTDQFNQFIKTLNTKDASNWSEFYSKTDFISTFVETDFLNKRDEWINLITKYFTTRETQKVELIDVDVNALAENLALLTSKEKSEMTLTDGQVVQSDHVFTLLWKKGNDGWKIIHSHESWVDKTVGQ